MKKIISLLGLSLACSALVVAGVAEHKVEEAKADYESHITVDAGFFTNWTDLAGSIADKNATFWDGESFQAVDTFYRGESAEGWTGTLTSRTWKQHTQYIYFQLGGAKNYDVTGDAVHLNIHYGSYSYPVYNDTFVENPMILRAFKIPDAAFNSLMSEASDFDMFIEIVDQQTEGYGFANFGYLNVNQTEDSTGDAMRWFVNNLNRSNREYDIAKRKQILENYYLNDGLKALFLKPYVNINDGFENNNDFINHWYFDWQYYNGATWDLHFDKAIGHDSYRPENTNMPFNKTGDGFFRGWFQNDELGGFVNGDGPVYRFISRPFVLAGTGLISIKMAGNASLQVIDTATRQDLVWEDLSNTTFKSSGDQDNLATSDFNTVTMVRHVVNLEAYLGRTLQIAIADIKDHDWGAMYADELVTNYNAYPGFKVDTFTQSYGGNDYNAYRTDIYVNSTLFDGENNKLGLRMVLEADVNKANDNAIINHVDESPAKEAYDFLQTYYETLRSPNNKFDYAQVSNEDKEALVSTYATLSHKARLIIKASTDIKYNDTFTEQWWSHLVDTSKILSVDFGALAYAQVKNIVSFNANGGSGTMTNITNIVGGWNLPANSFTPAVGYEFIGWKVNGEGETLQPNAEIDVTSDIELVAQWKLTTFTVSFDANGGTNTMPQVEVENGAEYTLPANGFGAPQGFKFKCWLVNDEEKAPGDKITITEDVEIKAVWVAIPKYTVSFDANGGSGDIESITVEENSLVALPECTFTPPEGKRFYKWKFGEELKNPGDEILVVEDVIIKAQWELIPIVTYTISFVGNGGSGSMALVHINEGLTYTLPENGFLAPIGKKFAGWNLNNDNEVRQPGYEITVNDNIVVTAQWELDPQAFCVIHFDANGGLGTMDDVTVKYGEQYTIPTRQFVAPEGKQFDSWLIGSVKYQPGQKITVTGDITLKASWVDIPKEESNEAEEMPVPEPQSQGPVMDFLNKVVNVFKQIFNKIVEFFKGLMA